MRDACHIVGTHHVVTSRILPSTQAPGGWGDHWASPTCDPKLRGTGFSLQVSHLPPALTAPHLVVRKLSSQKLKPSQGGPWFLSLFMAKKEPNGPLSRESD